MNRPITAIFDAGVFRPLDPVDWPNGTRAEIIPIADPPSTSDSPTPWPPGYFEQTAGALADEEFERPPQGDLPQRESW